jgi:hypothetical protein
MIQVWSVGAPSNQVLFHHISLWENLYFSVTTGFLTQTYLQLLFKEFWSFFICGTGVWT